MLILLKQVWKKKKSQWQKVENMCPEQKRHWQENIQEATETIIYKDLREEIRMVSWRIIKWEIVH